jgi:hypothetical protein
MNEPARRRRILLAGFILLAVLLVRCQTARPTIVSPVTAGPTRTAEPSASPVTPRPTLPATWTPVPPTAALTLPSWPTSSPTPNLRQTMVAQTTVAAGIHCQRYPEAWQVFSSPASAFAGWCLVVGAPDTLYEYRLFAPDGWVVNTFGDLTPNLSFSMGKNNVALRLYEAFAYGTYNYTGTLEEAPEQASVCDENVRCYGFIGPHETHLRQEVRRFENNDEIILDSFQPRELLALDSQVETPAGTLNIRRYYQIIPFRLYEQPTQRLFILELTWLEGAFTEAEYAGVLEKLELMALSVNQR